MGLPEVTETQAAVSRLASKLNVVDVESLDPDAIFGRVLAESLEADRDSPAIDVSAMDGYAVRLNDIQDSPGTTLPVLATTPAGNAPAELSEGTAVRVFTGAPVPISAECVIKREDTWESENKICVQLSRSELKPDMNIRRRGENTSRGDEILPAGTILDASAIAAVASFGARSTKARRKLRVCVLNTGDELAEMGESVQDWQIRDSNGPTLEAWLRTLPWIEQIGRQQVADTLASVEQSLESTLAVSDVIILTGGVSMGDTDYVPQAIENVGAEICFHRLPIRPGRPVLGAHRGGKLILGLPGNPVSVAVTSRVIGLPLLRAMSGARAGLDLNPHVQVTTPDDKHIALTWFRLVDIADDGTVRFTKSQGSGDLVSLAKSQGFVEIPANQSGAGPWPLYKW